MPANAQGYIKSALSFFRMKMGSCWKIKTIFEKFLSMLSAHTILRTDEKPNMANFVRSHIWDMNMADGKPYQLKMKLKKRIGHSVKSSYELMSQN